MKINQIKNIISGAIGSYPEYWTVKNLQDRVLFLTETQKRAKEAYNDIKAYVNFFNKNIRICFFPSDQNIFDLESQIKRNFTLYTLSRSSNVIVITSKDALDIKVRTKKEFLNDLINVKQGKEINREELIKKLIRIGYIVEDFIEHEGEFSIKGNFISIYIPFVGIVDIDMFGDFVENLFLRSKVGTRKRINEIDIYPLYDLPLKDMDVPEFDFSSSSTIKDYLENTLIVSVDTFTSSIRPNVQFISKGVNEDIGFSYEKSYKIFKLPLKRELYLKKDQVGFLSTYEDKIELDIEPLKEGDLIVHEDYGIGIYKGIETRHIRGKTYDFMILEYADGEKIYVSFLHFDKIHKYRFEGKGIKLDKPGGTSWRNLKKKVKNSLKNLAKDLLKLYSERKTTVRTPLNIEDELIYQFEKSFPFVETPDQARAIKDIKEDLSSEKPMERILCGDVGFGKTEVALRGIFINAVNGKQSLVLAPTTVLAFQHYQRFKERLQPFGVNVELLSRNRSKKEQNLILKKLEEGKVDVLISTHKILYQDVKFKNLGLLVVDEEHRFGVRAKEKIRSLKNDVDTLYMSATPIPRTLNMVLSGLKDISVINTPPEGRIEIRTIVSIYNEDIIKKAIDYELSRNGQVFYLYNKVEDIDQKTENLKQMFPKARIEYAHGQMKPSRLEDIFLKFVNKKIDILVCTTIIETGIDIPSANTLIIEDAQNFGLAQLYHLRGRVGRGNIQAFCYLLTDKEIGEKARKRIDTIKKLTRPGSGLKVSVVDMQIRGPGNIFGVEQKGFVKSVGFDMYVKLLKQAIEEIKGKNSIEADIQVKFDIYIPDSFISSPEERINIYRAVTKAVTPEEIDALIKYFEDFYSEIPEMFRSYLEIYKLKKLANSLKLRKVVLDEPVSMIQLSDETPVDIVNNLFNNFDVEKITGDQVYFKFKKEDIKTLTRCLYIKSGNNRGVI